MDRRCRQTRRRVRPQTQARRADRRPRQEPAGAGAARARDRGAASGIEYRSAQPITVNPRRRLIELLAVPYGIDALVSVGGRTIRESFSNTAFLGEQPKRILATRDHDPTRLVGKVTNLEPFHREGLVATLQVADTALGRESVELARDQCLDASIGFQIPDPAGEQWEGRSRRRVTKALLREVSLVPEPAYPTRVLDVRSPPFDDWLGRWPATAATDPRFGREPDATSSPAPLLHHPRATLHRLLNDPPPPRTILDRPRKILRPHQPRRRMQAMQLLRRRRVAADNRNARATVARLERIVEQQADEIAELHQRLAEHERPRPHREPAIR